MLRRVLVICLAVALAACSASSDDDGPVVPTTQARATDNPDRDAAVLGFMSQVGYRDQDFDLARLVCVSDGITAVLGIDPVQLRDELATRGDDIEGDTGEEETPASEQTPGGLFPAGDELTVLAGLIRLGAACTNPDAAAAEIERLGAAFALGEETAACAVKGMTELPDDSLLALHTFTGRGIAVPGEQQGPIFELMVSCGVDVAHSIDTVIAMNGFVPEQHKCVVEKVTAAYGSDQAAFWDLHVNQTSDPLTRIGVAEVEACAPPPPVPTTTPPDAGPVIGGHDLGPDTP